MSRPDATPEPEPGEPPVEADSRFPSGPWTGFFLQPFLPGRHRMELHLTFRGGRLRGEGRDWVDRFVMSGRYDVGDGKCWWTKTYVGRHSLHYQGYNEGRGIWGRWEWPGEDALHGGFHIWPVGLGLDDPTRLAETVDLPATVEAEAGAAV